MWDRPYDPRVTIRPPRAMIRPVVIVGASRGGSWDVTVTGIESSGSGTTYTSWVTLSGSPPSAAGYFQLPATTLAVFGTGTAVEYLELGSGDVAFASGIEIHSLRVNGPPEILNTSPASSLLSLTYNRTLTQLRWAVVATAPIQWWQTGATLYRL